MASTQGPVAARQLRDEVDVLQEKEDIVTAFAADGAITKTTGIKKLTKGSAGAYTLAAPTADENGARVTIVSGSAFAHVVTATNLVHDGATGGAKDTMTFAAFLGASIELAAVDLFWHVISKNAVTVAGA